ncbi:MAG TPA: beta-ketoacyl-ACP synthase II [Bacteroidales bacterium]|jgi:3-oxoacyl-[acyl-carrier-protein] synthase II|nr:beta-ketoacyl-ACP synthase II [Bacteroidales bacterium]OQB62341.1 MAG: 3-oxoacyl-(acyl-carrier-protein) synthase 2 [Bacteroidetes bacterium ADurb.Bin145]NMD01957.1 beta-ketoacyl-ACP synthase II [Bacteroidales bacterium]HOU02505.1 beta-ketoacyl-ACP synthase II [Bacteroidales bacterium]HQG62663.1 beta-ketoacyl-ACP synthase II [Bacteroidales bacterium]
MRRVVVTGLGALTPIGNNLREYWDGLEKGVSGAVMITRFNTEKFKTKFACELKGYNSADFFDRKEVNKLDLYSQYALVVTDEAIKDSGLDLVKTDKSRIGVIWGSGIGGLDTFYNSIKQHVLGDGTPRFSPFFIPKMIADIAAGTISIRYGFTGPNFATVSACASSTNALIDAINYIRWGKADIFISGGSEACINEPGIGGFNATMALSTKNSEYQTASRPFDKTRDGFVLGEGAGALIVEEYEHAKARGAKIYAELVGTAMTADAYHVTAPHPEGLGARNVMKFAIEDAGLAPADVDYINVHGTSTPLGDIAEAKAILDIFGEHAFSLNISATKSMTGHLLGAAGAIEAIAAIFSIVNDTIPPTINFSVPDPEIDQRLNLTFNKAQKRKVNVAISNTFGFGGHNASVVLKKAEV